MTRPFWPVRFVPLVAPGVLLLLVLLHHSVINYPGSAIAFALARRFDLVALSMAQLSRDGIMFLSPACPFTTAWCERGEDFSCATALGSSGVPFRISIFVLMGIANFRHS